MAILKQDDRPAGDPGRIRAFVALDLPTSVVEAVAGWQREALGDREGLRPIRPEALHLTLAFLGERDHGEIERAQRVLIAHGRDPAAVPVRLEREAIGVPARRPRVVAFPAASAAVVALQRALSADLVDAGLLEPEKRPFWPHLSVARVRGDPKGPKGRRRHGPLLEGLPSLPAQAGHTFGAVRVALYRSELRSQGAHYSVLADFDLPRTAADEVI